MSGFQHSVKVPTQYKKVAAALKTASENRQKSLKTLIFEEKHARIGNMHAVLKQYLDNRRAIDAAIDQTKILEDNPRLNPYLCKVLVTELIFGRKILNGESKPVQTVRGYKDRLLKQIGVDEESSNTKAQKKGKIFLSN